MSLESHNRAELPLVQKMEQDEWHLMQEAFAGLDRNDPDVVAAIGDRVADIITNSGEGAHMASIVDQPGQSS